MRKVENFAYREIYERIYSNPRPLRVIMYFHLIVGFPDHD